ncbi:MAG: phosphoribosyl-ATP diphosphatase [Acidimicrobiales bacterium]|nr:MAG: phosphoribosyl-ATP diphosphatase [Acidimicrobiales bacterium]
MKTFDELFNELQRKVEGGDAESETVRAVRNGVHSIGKKIVEEAAEVWLAAEYQSDGELAEEISQLLYHVQVMMLARQIDLTAVYQRL